MLSDCGALLGVRVVKKTILEYIFSLGNAKIITATYRDFKPGNFNL